MSFSVSFHPAASPGATGAVPVSYELDADYDIFVMEACSALADAGGSRFHISGFGSEEWPLDIGYDLSAFLEQLPALLAGVREQREVEVDLYSQGVERTLTFKPVGKHVLIHCASRTDWTPNPECERVAQDDLIAMLVKLADDFARGLQAIRSI